MNSTSTQPGNPMPLQPSVGSFRINQEPPTFFVDMDEVVADWFALARTYMPEIINNASNFQWPDLYALAPNLYRDLPPTKDMHELWDYVKKYNPVMLTAIPRRWSWPKVTQHKREWMAEHIGAHVEVRFGPHAEDKQFHCKKPNDVLIDDNHKNITQWISRGGIGILHTSAADTIAQLKTYGY